MIKLETAWMCAHCPHYVDIEITTINCKKVDCYHRTVCEMWNKKLYELEQRLKSEVKTE